MFNIGLRVIFQMKKVKPTISLTLSPSSSSDTFSEYAYSKTKIKLTRKTNKSDQSTKIKLLKTQQRDISYHLETLKRISKYRGDFSAPVDSMGCDQLYDDKVDVLSQKFQILVSIMLSIQTKDETTSHVVRAMVKQGILQPKLMSKMRQEEVESYIKRVNYHKTKAKNLIKAAQSFVENGAPTTYEEVMNFSGVGIKVATLYMKVAEGVNIGIGTDTHVHRIVNKLGWVSTKTPEDTEHKLREYFPKDYWEDMNHALVGFGQLICDAKKPKCKQCPVADRCPSSNL